MLTAAGVVATAAISGCAGPEASDGRRAAGAAGQASGTTLPGAVGRVPVQGGVVFAEQRVIVTQPRAGVFHAFSAVCTHQGCTVAGVVDGAISCPCHGSRFDSSSGSVLQGPAEQPLARQQVTVEGNDLRLS